MSGKRFPQFKYVLLCDDIREEKSNKVTVVGLYSTKIILDRLPGLVPKLCLRICVDISKARPEAFNVFLKTPDGQKLGPVRFQPPPIPPGEEEVAMNISMSPFSVPKEGIFEVIAEQDGKEEVMQRFLAEKRKPAAFESLFKTVGE